ncbi:MAG: GNAT family N-acetyltransferase [Sulfuricaulis sp.]
MKTHIQVIDTTEGLQALRDDWNRLLDCAESVSIFSSWEWQFHWWKNYGKHRSLRVLVVKNDDKILGILPLYIQSITFFRFLPLAVLRLVGTGGDTSPDYMGPLLEPGSEQDACLALSEFILHELAGWDILDFTDMPDSLALAKTLADMSDRDGLSHYNDATSSIPIIRLPATWEDYLSQLHRDRRYRVRKLRRKLVEAFTVVFYALENRDRLDEVIDLLINLHQLRWENRKQGGSFASPEYINFHRDAIKACFDRDWIRLYCLELNGKIMAIYYCYRFRNEVLYFQSGFDPAFEDFVPGQILLGYAVEHAIQEGNKVFDLLKGTYRYKTEWANDHRQTCDLSIYRKNIRAQLVRTRLKRLPKLKGAIKSVFQARGSVKTS